MTSNKFPRIDLGTILLSAYMINMFRLNALPSWIQQVIVIGSVLIYLVWNNKYILGTFKRTKQSRLSKYIFFLLIYALFAGAAFLYSPHDFGYLSMMLSMVLLCAYMFTIVVRLHKQGHGNNLLESFFAVYMYVMSLYVCVTALMIAFPSLKRIIIDGLEIDSYSSKMLSNPYYATRVGWNGFAGYNSSIKCSLGCCMALYFIAKNNEQRVKTEKKIYVILVLMLVGNFFYARTGFFISCLCVMFFIGYTAFRQHKIKKLVIYCVMIGSVLAVSYMYVMSHLEESYMLQWASEAIISLLTSGKIESTSYNTLQSMYFMPPIDTVLIGDGRYSGSGIGYYMNTDVGIMRNILYFGIFGTISLYFVVIWGIFQLDFRVENKRYYLMSLFLLIMFIGYEYKGESTPLLLPLIFVFGMMKRSEIGSKKRRKKRLKLDRV